MYVRKWLVRFISYGVSLCIVSLFLVTPIYLFEKVRVKKVFIICKEPITAGLDIFQNNHMFFLPISDIRSSILSANTYLMDVTIEKQYPTTVNIQCNLRIPIAILVLSSSEKWIDENGFIFEKRHENFPLLRVEMRSVRPIEIGNHDWRIIKTAAYIQALEKMSISLTQFVLDDDISRFYMKTKEGIEMIVPQSQNPDVTVASLQTIIQRFRIEGKFIVKIDFQFDKPIVTLMNR